MRSMSSTGLRQHSRSMRWTGFRSLIVSTKRRFGASLLITLHCIYSRTLGFQVCKIAVSNAVLCN